MSVSNIYKLAILLSISLLLLILLFLYIFNQLTSSYKPLDIYDFPALETIKIPIKNLLLYPVRGIKGIEVNQLYMTPSGALFDREWIMVRADDGKHRSLSSTPEMTRFRQKLIYNLLKDKVNPIKLVIQIGEGHCEGMKVREMEINVEREYLEKDFYSAKKPKGATFQYQGYKESDEVNKWLSSALGFDVVIIRAAKNRQVPTDEKHVRIAQPQSTDMRKAFITTAAIHVINLKSIESLKEDITNKYKSSLSKQSEIPSLDFDYQLFRPNVVIDFGHPYSEEEIYQSRIENILMRQVGPCERCKLCAVDWKTGERHIDMEPYKHLCEERNLQGVGPIFGVYLQPDILSKNLPGITASDERLKLPMIDINDQICVRVQKRTYSLKNPSSKSKTD